jgi:hypothetical protein
MPSHPVTPMDRVRHLPLWVRLILLSALVAAVPTLFVAGSSGSAVRSTVMFALAFALMFGILLYAQVRGGLPLTSRVPYPSEQPDD